MRRKLFYFSVAIMAFVTGICFLYLFSFRTSVTDIAVQTEPTQDLAAVSVLSKPSLHQETGIESLISDKEKALLLFEPTLKKWLRKENIPEIIEPSPEILQRIEATKLYRYEAPYLTRMAQKSYKPSLIDLNDDRSPELSILIDCGEPNGCELWIFREIAGDFEIILRTSWELEQFKITKKDRKSVV